MAGIYIHIPFCRRACHYCNFHFSTSLQRKNDFVSALLEEIERKRLYFEGESVETIYLGGGTPSLLSAGELEQIMKKLRTVFPIEAGAEVTLEANPDDITIAGNLQSWRAAGINRLSIGIQSFYEEDLQWMNRAHTASQALNSITMAQEEGFDNISIDLIYGSPILTDEHWARNVEQAIRLKIPHLSCYALTVEPKTALDKMISQHKKEAVDPDTQARQFLLLMDWLERAGYEHYEISNFALPGKRSRHNSSYWQGKKYLGLGPSAHSYDGGSRQWNIANNALYILPPEGQPLFEKEDLTAAQRLNEYIMISLRTKEGCNAAYVAATFGEAAGKKLMAQAGRYIQEGKMNIEYVNDPNKDQETGQRLVLTREGKLLADGIAADLFQ
jgi:oxygen-independent coproporphyrinogen-3 oxidase